MKILNPITLPIKGNILIEASAGTGKTFTISLLYLRLLLGLNKKHEYYRPLSVEEILVVTFTEIATIELRKRIRNDIHQLRLSCIQGRSFNPMHQLLLEQIDDNKQAIKRLFFAEKNIYNAAIYTIHSFCRKVLKFFDFESNTSFRNKILSDEYTLFKKITLNFWNNLSCSISLDVARIISNEWNNAEDLLFTLYPLFRKKNDIINCLSFLDKTLELKHKNNLDQINSIKNIWINHNNNILKILNSSKINKRIYNNKNLKNWVDKITVWANSITLDYTIPKDLQRFRQSIINEKNKDNDKIIDFRLFKEIESFFINPISLREDFIKKALAEITISINKEKHLQGLLSFDDLLHELDKALQSSKGDLLARNIGTYFPVSLIDEFQDTDLKQYRIFQKIYIQQKLNQSLIIIGDPKQSIYSFRGADISSYINMRCEISDIYTLDTNWRSSSEMIESVNCLFSKITLPFMSPQIPFIPIKSAIDNKKIKFIFNGNKYPSLNIWIHPVNNIDCMDYEYDIAKQCAADISNLLLAKNKKKAFFLKKNNKLHLLQPSDIAVLVRNRREANLIRNALNLFSVSSVYLSEFDSVYSTVEAREFFYLLKAIQSPTQEQLIRTALATSMFSIDSKTIESLSNNNLIVLIKKFSRWKLLWQKYGLMPMFRNIILEYNIAENILASENGKRRLTDLMHISELLQAESMVLIGPNDLLNFFFEQINKPNNQISNQQLRLEEDCNFIKIITIHKSKGLQYPLTWLPFAVSFMEHDNNIYCNNNNGLSLNTNEDVNDIQSFKERMAEDLRLFYVAVTRSIYHCSIGIGTFIKGGYNTKKNTNDLYKTALGYLLKCNKYTNIKQLKDYISELKYINIKAIDIDLKPNKKWQEKKIIDTTLNNLKLNRISSDLCQSNIYPEQENEIGKFTFSSDFDENNLINYYVKKNSLIKEKSSLIVTSHFPNDLKFNTFIISLFKSMNLNTIPKKSWLEYQLNRCGYSLELLSDIHKWIIIILCKPLNSEGLSLINMKETDYLNDFKFFLMIKNNAVISGLNRLLSNKDKLSKYENNISFDKEQGIIQGYIDLVFIWHNKYYLLYYRLDYLGSHNICYTAQSIKSKIFNRSFNFKNQLCTLAFHRYLKHRLNDYSYEKHFGGVFYLFLKGLSENLLSNGIIKIFTDKNSIQKLDILIGKNK
ncbi:exodeoxyribonuclease V subunit beta [Candidatus Pantoea edessiphila]|nr:exodeoxyribonuclease V subunit beta [Candidatus Pantoea edessiphila]